MPSIFNYHVALNNGRQYFIESVNVPSAITAALSQSKADDLAAGVPEPPKRRGRKPNPVRFVKNLGEK